MNKTLALALTVGLSTISGTAAFAEYPEKPIKMIIAYSPGGGTDTAARTLIPYIEKYLGNGASITVINKPGAGGEIGFTALSQAKPDGYTIGFINTPNILTIPISRKTRYTMDDIKAVSNVVYDPGAFNTLPNSGFKTLKDLVVFAKENPGVITYGTSGIGGDDHLAALQFSRAAGVEMRHIPYSGSADVRAAVLGGHVKLAVLNISESIELANNGKLVALGQMGEERWQGAPNVPTFGEQGYDVIMGSNRGIGAPANFPKDALNKLEVAIGKAVKDPEFLVAAKKQNLPLAYQNSEDFGNYLKGLNKNLQVIWKETPWVK